VSSSLHGVQLQDPRSFTVQIGRAEAGTTLGTGIVVSAQGLVATCAHVVRSAGVDVRGHQGAEVAVYFPQAQIGQPKSRRATVVACFPSHDDDVVLLQLVGGPPPLREDQVAILGKAEESFGHEFISYGYRRLEDYVAGYAAGKILGAVEPPQGRALLVDPVQLSSSQVNQGMSGSAVLDVERNLVVALVSETWFPDQSTKDRDTAWAVNARALTLEPFKLPVRESPYPLGSGFVPKPEVAELQAAAEPRLLPALDTAPSPLIEWVGREDLLSAITADWESPHCRVTGLIGFGGEGKSSLARHWVGGLLADTSKSRPHGVLWWDFYKKPDVDEFLEASLAYLSSGRLDPRGLPSANVRAQAIAAMLGAGRYLFVLDGLEVEQFRDGDRYGMVVNSDLREFIHFFATPAHDSFCLITSRAPVLDLMPYTTYSQREVGRLSQPDGRALMRKLGVTGSDTALGDVVTVWGGHALTLSLLAGYLVERHSGNVERASEIPPPTAEEPRYARVRRVLNGYDGILSETDRAFLTVLSAFRKPVRRDSLQQALRTASPMAKQFTGDQSVETTVTRLLACRMLRASEGGLSLTLHPLVRAHYIGRLNASVESHVRDVHSLARMYWLATAPEASSKPRLEEIAPLVEAVHHGCASGAYNESWRLCVERILVGERYVILYELGAYDLGLQLMREFFPNRDMTREPQVTEPKDKGDILATIGYCFMTLGHLKEAAAYYGRGIPLAVSVSDWNRASIIHLNLAQLLWYLGKLPASTEAASRALDFARKSSAPRFNERNALTYLAWSWYLRGDLKRAGRLFAKAQSLERKLDPTKQYLYSLRGVQHSEYLRKTGRVLEARRVASANLTLCQRKSWLDDLSRSLRILADVEPATSPAAKLHYHEAVRIARNISFREVLIEALLARGSWAARQGQVDGATNDLREALDYAVSGGFRTLEADVLISLARISRIGGDTSAGQVQAERARVLSAEMGYHWGRVDAEELLRSLRVTA